jgi:tRNA(Ile)-lysidine synthase
VPGVYPLDRIGYTLSLQAGRDADFHEMGQDPWTVLMDRDKVFFPLGLRNFRPGDRFVPLGMRGHKKVKDFFIELKIPSSERERIPILTQEDKPVWVCGLRLDDRFKVTGETRNMLKAVLTRKMPLPELPTPDSGI